MSLQFLGSSSGSGGSGADLSAVDQDIVVENNHVVDVQSSTIGSDAGAHATIGWDDNNYGVAVVGSAENASTDLYVQTPDGLQYIDLYAGNGSASIGMHAGGGANASLQVTVANTIDTFDVRHQSDRGPVLKAPDGSYHRIVVANDGTLSTVPVTYPG
jgi:hypothetical protein